MRPPVPGLPRPRRPGFTLIEMLILMTALTVLTGVAAVALTGALRLRRASEAALDRMTADGDLADQFRADVAQATAAPEHWEDDTAGPACLILALGADRHVIYRAQEDGLRRREVMGASTHVQKVAPGGPGAIEFERSEGGRLVTLRLFTVQPNGPRRPRVAFTAALGGDRQ